MLTRLKLKTARRRTAWLTLAASLLFGTVGCGHKDANAADPDPNYYKGADFHGRTAKR